MDWDDLKFVLALNRTGTLVGAGRLLNVNTSTVGRRIGALEKALGTRLYHRRAGGYHATDAARRVVACAEEMELQATALQRQLDGSDARLEGSVRVTALDNFLDRLVVPALPEFVEKYPGLQLTLESDLRLFELARGEADIAVRTSEPTHPEMIKRRLGPVTTAFYQARGAAWTDELPLIGLPDTAGNAHYNQYLLEKVPTGRIVARANTERRITDMVRLGIGIGCIDCFVGESDGEIERLSGFGVFEETLFAVYHMEMRRSGRVRAVLEFLTSVVAGAQMEPAT